MHMVYNSDCYVVVQFDVPVDPSAVNAVPASAADDAPAPALTRGGFEIVDKFARKEIFIEGAMAASFQAGVEVLMHNTPSPSNDDFDAFIEPYATLMHQPLVHH